MKKNIKMAAVACMLLSAFVTVSCDKNTDNGGENPPQGETFELGDGSKDNFEIASDMTLTYPNVYTLKGFVYVPDGVTLTIEPGVVIKGDKATQGTLIIERGGKIMAQGTPERPIVFTSAQAPGSRKPGDWGGIILLGKAPNNLGEQTIEGGVRSKHGGNDPADNSGVLSYVRVEFPGIEYSTDNEINGITFGSVGSGTKIDHLQVSYSGDDSYEWFGGTANAKYLVAYSGWDDDFDTDNGFSGKVQFAMGVRNPRIGDKSASNGFESDNNGDGAATEPYTSCVFANVSLFGRRRRSSGCLRSSPPPPCSIPDCARRRRSPRRPSPRSRRRTKARWARGTALPCALRKGPSPRRPVPPPSPPPALICAVP